MAAVPQDDGFNLSGVLNLSILREKAERDLTEALDRIRGKKGLVIDPCLTGPLNLVINVQTLKSHGVEKIYKVMPELQTECKNVVYLVRPNLASMKFIADHIHTHAKEGSSKDYTVLFVPRKTLMCEKVLENAGVLGEIEIGEYGLDLIPFDDDVLSLELEYAYRDCYLDGDRTALYYSALSLMKLQTTYGLIPTIMGVGHKAKLVSDMMLRMRQELAADEPHMAPEIDRVILIDRSVDMYTPMLTQLTYEGLIDEVFGIHNAYVDLDPEIASGQKGSKKFKQQLNSSDKLYAEIRDLNFAALSPLLNRKAQVIEEGYESRHDAKTVSEIKEFVAKFTILQAEHKSLGIHTNLAEKIMHTTKNPAFHARLECEQNLISGADTSSAVDYVEELINRQAPLVQILRVVCLASLVNNGFKAKTFDFLRKEIVQAYGFEHMFTLNKLEKLGLFKRYDTKSPLPALRKGLHLWSDEVNEAEPTDIAYVYSGYAPLTCRLVQYASRPGWRSMESVLGALPGPAFEERQALPAGIQRQEVAPGAAQKPKVTLVFFIGGCTFTEIAAIRFLSEVQAESDQQEDFVIATTKLMNGDSLLNTLINPLDNGLAED